MPYLRMRALLGERLRRLRERQGLTVTAAAARMHVREDELVAIEEGEAETPLGSLSGVAEALGVRLDELLPAPAPESRGRSHARGR